MEREGERDIYREGVGPTCNPCVLRPSLSAFMSRIRPDLSLTWKETFTNAYSYSKKEMGFKAFFL